MGHEQISLRKAAGSVSRRPRALRVLATIVVVACGAPVLAGGPFVANPLPRPLFSIDAASPTVIEFGIPPHSVLEVDGMGRPPGVAFQGAGLGLGPGDDIDGLSDPHGTFSNSTSFVILFSVGANSSGAVTPHPPISVAFPFNVQQQASLEQAAGDEFMALSLFTRGGSPQPQGPATNNNTLVGNQGDVGGVDHELKPDNSPGTSNIGQSKDNLDSLQRDTSAAPGPGAATLIYFTLTTDSPSNPAGPGIRSGASVYLDADPAAPGKEILFIAPGQLGLLQNDDIDALVVFENGDGTFDPTTEQVLYSLAPGSPSLAMGFSPADILTNPTGPGPAFPVLFASAQNLGLLATDNVDALEVWPCNDLDQCIQDFAVQVSGGPGIPALSPTMIMVMAGLLLLAAGVVLNRLRRLKPADV